MGIPTDQEIRDLLDRLESETADDIESRWLELKPWQGPREDLRVAAEYAACFANADGGAIVFGVSDRRRGRVSAIHGAKGYDLDLWRRAIFDATRPGLTVDVEEMEVPEGTGRLLVVRVPKGENPPYGTSQGLFKKRVGKSCMPLDLAGFQRGQMAGGSRDWSGEPVDGLSLSDLNPLEVARARGVLRRIHPDSELLALSDAELLSSLGAVRRGRVTHAGLLLFGSEDLLRDLCPHHQIHYVYQVSDLEVARNDSYRAGLLNALERIEQTFLGPANPEHELSLGLLNLRIPAFPIEVVREAVLNAVTHRDYSDPGEVLCRHAREQLVVTSPGGFLAGITPQNILRQEPVSRNRTLAEAFEKLGLVERAGIGRRKIFATLLSYGKRAPRYETDGERVTLRIFDGSFDERMARLVAQWRGQEREIDLDGLLVLSFLRENAFIDAGSASDLLQLPRESARTVLDRLAQPKTGFLERRGQTKAATFHLARGVAEDLHGKSAYTRVRGLNPIRYAEMVRAYLADHGAITPRECRELLGLGESATAKVEVSRLFRRWSGEEGFLRREGQGKTIRYLFREGADR